MSSKLREALERSTTRLKGVADCYPEIRHLMQDQIEENEAAIAEPVRNCEVGTPEEQNIRHGEWCHNRGIDGAMDVACAYPDMGCHLCFARWAQMPYGREASDKNAKEASDKKTIEWLDEIKREALYYLEQGTDCFTVSAGPWTLTYDSKESEVKE